MKFASIGALVFSGVIAFSSCGQQSKEAAQAPPASTPAAAPASNGEVRLPADSPQLQQIHTELVQASTVPVGLISAPGKVEANANRLSHVVLPLAGRITSVDVKIGDFVRQGQPLLTFESPDVDAAVSSVLQAQAAVTQAKSAAAKAQKDLDREKDLFDHGAIAQKEVLTSETLVVQAQAAVEQAHAALEQSRRRLTILGIPADSFGQRVTIKAPISGKVLDLSVVNGEYRNDLSAPLITIADLSTVWVTSDVPETAIRQVKNGESVQITLDSFPGETFRGRVTLIGDVVDPQSRTIKVRAEMANPDGRLKPEMFGTIQLAEQTEIRPTVPPAAVISAEGQALVWRETGTGVFLRTPVTTGVQTNGRIAILAGLTPSDRVVVDGVMLLQSK
jgi:cobalt-zinc-cadmium efflux system membrane fusion protein